LCGQVHVAAYKDSRNLRQLKEKHNKHVLSTYNKAYAFFPKVSNRQRFVFPERTIDGCMSPDCLTPS